MLEAETWSRELNIHKSVIQAQIVHNTDVESYQVYSPKYQVNKPTQHYKLPSKLFGVYVGD